MVLLANSFAGSVVFSDRDVECVKQCATCGFVCPVLS